MERLRHAVKLIGQLFRFGREQRAPWLLPLLILLALASLLVFAGQSATPFLYSLW